MCQLRWLFLIPMLFFGLNLDDQPIATAQESGDYFLGREIDLPNSFFVAQQQALKLESEILRSELDLTPEQMQKLEIPDEKIKARSSAIESEHGYLFEMTLRHLEPELKKELWQKAAELTPGPNGIIFTEYQQSAEQLQELRNRNGQKGLISWLDDYLSFSEQQTQQLEEYFAANWVPYWNEQVSMSIWNDYEYIGRFFSYFSTEELANILTAEQMAVLQEIKNVEIEHNDLSSGKFDINQTKLDCIRLLDLRIQEMDSLLGLNEKQLQILNVAKKGIASKTSKIFQKAVQKAEGQPFANELYELTKTTLVNHATSERTWSKSIQKILTEDQLNLWSERQRKRREYIVRQSCIQSVLLLNLGQNYQESVDLAEVYFENAMEQDSSTRSKISNTTCYMPDPAKAVLRDKIRKRLTVHVDRRKEQIKAQTDAADEDDEDVD